MRGDGLGKQRGEADVHGRFAGESGPTSHSGYEPRLHLLPVARLFQFLTKKIVKHYQMSPFLQVYTATDGVLLQYWGLPSVGLQMVEVGLFGLKRMQELVHWRSRDLRIRF